MSSSPTGPERTSQMREIVALMRRRPDFRRLFSASVVSFLGDWFALVAVASLVEELTGSEGSTALVFAAEVLPFFVFSPLAGVLADRLDRRTLLVGSAVARIFPALGLVVASVTGQAWLAYVCVATISALASFFEPVVSAVVPNVVERDEVPVAQAAIGSVWGSMLFVGAAIGGLVAAVLGRDASFLINAGTFVVSALLVARIVSPLNRGVVHAGASVLGDLREVWTYARARKPVAALMVTKAGVGVGNGVVGILPIYALTVFQAGEAGIGVLLAARGLGALVGPHLGRRLTRDDGRRIVLWNGLSILFYAAAYAALPLAGSLAVAFLLVTAAHVGGGNQWVASTTGLQLATPDHVRGRVLGVDFALATVTMGVSAILAGVVAERASLATASWLLAGFSFTYGVAWLAWTRDLWGPGSTDPLGAAGGGLDAEPVASTPAG
ncbi:MAG: MFS transporter [Actinomycetes bacterium]